MKVAHVTTVGVSLYGLLINQMRSLRRRATRLWLSLRRVPLRRQSKRRGFATSEFL